MLFSGGLFCFFSVSPASAADAPSQRSAVQSAVPESSPAQRSADARAKKHGARQGAVSQSVVNQVAASTDPVGGTSVSAPLVNGTVASDTPEAGSTVVSGGLDSTLPSTNGSIPPSFTRNSTGPEAGVPRELAPDAEAVVQNGTSVLTQPVDGSRLGVDFLGYNAAEGLSVPEVPLVSLFGVKSELVRDLSMFTQEDYRWINLRQRMTKEPPFFEVVKKMPLAVRSQWDYLAKNYSRMDKAKQLRAINGFFNHFPAVQDKMAHGADEHWATPQEFIARFGGDCEDYAIAKFYALIAMGWSADEMWIAGVEDMEDRRRKHAILAVRLDTQVFILDNLSRPKYIIMPEKYFVKHYKPLFAVNEAGFWHFSSASARKVQEAEEKQQTNATNQMPQP